jgi:hypothetical protein
MPHFTHDCDVCKYLGSGKYEEQDADFYICEKTIPGYRTFIARYGNEGGEYCSNMLFCCVGLTPLDMVALYNNIELTPEEEERLKNKAVEFMKEKFFMNSIQTLKGLDAGVSFGSGNIMFKD